MTQGFGGKGSLMINRSLHYLNGCVIAITKFKDITKKRVEYFNYILQMYYISLFIPLILNKNYIQLN